MIDAHVHLWQLGANDCVWPTAADGILHRDFVLDDLNAVLDAAAIERAILIQSQESVRDTAWLLEIAAATTRIAGVVGWADLREPSVMHHLSLKGLRPMVQGRAADWYDDPTLDGGLADMAANGLVLDALVRPVHLPALERLAGRHPDLTIVIDHAAKPEGSADRLAAWRAAIAPLARHPNVHVKLSGLLTEMPPGAVGPTVETLLVLFGADRLLWGSDWPVLTAVADYRAWFDLAAALIPQADHNAVFGGNAARVYRIAETGHA
jgi:L-fuconolactonase